MSDSFFTVTPIKWWRLPQQEKDKWIALASGKASLGADYDRIQAQIDYQNFTLACIWRWAGNSNLQGLSLEVARDMCNLLVKEYGPIFEIIEDVL